MSVRAIKVGIVVGLGLIFGSLAVSARNVGPQSPPPVGASQLVPLVTNLDPLPVSTKYDIASIGGVLNQSGDYLFANSTGLFLRRAGASTATRVWQMGMSAPGYPGSRSDIISTPRINSSGLVAFRIELAMTTGEIHGTVITWDGSTATVIANGSQVAPGSGGSRYERNLLLAGLNDAGDLLMTAPLTSTGTAQTALFLAHAGQAPVRLIGVGDAAPGIPGATLSSLSVTGFNNSGEILFSSTLTGGPGGTALFRYGSGVFSKVSATGDAAPGGGTIALPNSSRLNNAGTVIFQDNLTVFRHTVANGVTVALAHGTALPIGGTTSTTTGPTVHALCDNGDTLLTVAVTGSAFTQSALLRITPGSQPEIAAYRGFPFANGTLNTWTAVSANASGVVSFVGLSSTATIGLYQQVPNAVSAVERIRQGQATGAAFGGTYSLSTSTQTLNNGALYFHSNVTDGTSLAGTFLWSAGGVKVLVDSEQPLPAGSILALRNLFMAAAGNHIGFIAALGGGSQTPATVNVATRVARVAAVEGQALPFAAGGRMTSMSAIPVYVSASGAVLLSPTVVGGNNPGRWILLSKPDGSFAKIAAPGDLDSANRVLGSLALTSLLGQTAITPAGHVLFSATVNGGSRSYFIGIEGSAPVKVAAIQDNTLNGGTILSLGTGSTPVINNADRVLFGATITGGASGLYLSSAGVPHQKIAQTGDAAPGGGTFAGFKQAVLNNGGDVAFAATTNGGSGSGIFLYEQGVGLTALALNGGAAPGGGNYLINTVLANLRPDVIINDQRDAMFMSDLIFTSATTGYFARRAADGFVTSVVRGGDPVPGTPATFNAFSHTLNSSPGELFQLSDTGDLSFLGSFQSGGTRVSGTWHVAPDSGIEEVVVRSEVSPAFGGGVPVLQSQQPAWMSGGRLALRVNVGNGSFADSIMLFTPVTASVTSIGTQVSVTPIDAVTNGTPVNVQYSSVTQPGETTLVTSASGPALPRGFAVAGNPLIYDVSSTAQFTGQISVCINFAGQVFPAGAVIRLLHYENGAWVDVTSSGPNGTTICGITTTLSPFAVVQALNVPSANIIQNGDFSNGSTGWSKFEDPFIDWAVNGGVFEFHRVQGNQAVVLQNTGVPFAANSPIVAHFDLGNSDPVRKRVSILIHASDFTDLSVCTFWLPANAPMRTYAMRTHTTAAWSGSTISIYAATVGTSGGKYQLDNVVMGPGSGESVSRTECMDPLGPAVQDLPDGDPLLVNGNFSDDLANWVPFGTITAQVTGGVAEFIRPSNAAPSGALLQPTSKPIAAGNVVTTTFQLGNSSSARKRITILLHDQFFVDLSACTFWLSPGQPLTSYTMRSYTTAPWTSATVSFYPATTDQLQWFQLDNVTLGVTPGLATEGSDCLEGVGPPPAPPAASPVIYSVREGARPLRDHIHPQLFDDWRWPLRPLVSSWSARPRLDRFGARFSRRFPISID